MAATPRADENIQKERSVSSGASWRSFVVGGASWLVSSGRGRLSRYAVTAVVIITGIVHAHTKPIREPARITARATPARRRVGSTTFCRRVNVTTWFRPRNAPNPTVMAAAIIRNGALTRRAVAYSSLPGMIKLYTSAARATTTARSTEGKRAKRISWGSAEYRPRARCADIVRTSPVSAPKTESEVPIAKSAIRRKNSPAPAAPIPFETTRVVTNAIPAPYITQREASDPLRAKEA